MPAARCEHVQPRSEQRGISAAGAGAGRRERLTPSSSLISPLFPPFLRMSDIRYREAPRLTRPGHPGGGQGTPGAEERPGAGDPYDRS
jgi:hypothetical protein